MIEKIIYDFKKLIKIQGIINYINNVKYDNNKSNIQSKYQIDLFSNPENNVI